MSHFLVPFIAATYRQLDRDATEADHFAVREALIRLIGTDDAALVLRAAFAVDRAARRSVRLPFGRALALIQAPIDFLALAQASGPVLFIRRDGGPPHHPLPADVPVERFRATSRPVVQPLPLP